MIRLLVPLLLIGLLLALGLPSTGAAEPQAIHFAFWNLENLFDSEDDPDNPGDDEFLPGEGWTAERYALKLDRLAEVVRELDVHLLAVCEVENARVLEDLVATDELAKLGYRVAHRDSPDKRGIDLGLIYRKPFELSGSDALTLHPIEIDPPTRGILEVRLTAHGTPLTVFINHWPSRRGGVAKSLPFRRTAAQRLRYVVLQREKSLKAAGVEADLLVIGDFNDDPFDESVRQHLRAVRSRNAALNNETRQYLYNPSWRFLGQTDLGTLYYNREWVWNVFDQVIVNRGLLQEPGFRLDDKSLRIYAPDKMRDHYRRPLRFRKNHRTGDWSEGYSDHFPVGGTLWYEPKVALAPAKSDEDGDR